MSGRSVQLVTAVSDTFKPTDGTRLNAIRQVGLANFRDIFARASTELVPVFIWTVVFAFSTVVLNGPGRSGAGRAAVQPSTEGP